MLIGLIVMSGIFFLSAPIVGSSGGQEAKDISTVINTQWIQRYEAPLYFIPNKGQVNGKAKFYAKTSRYTLWMTEQSLVFDGIKVKEAVSSTGKGEISNLHRDVSRLVFLESRTDLEMIPVDITGHQVNYLKGNSPSKWITGLSTSKAVLFKNLYEGIDLKVYGIEKQIEYDWIVKAGSHPEQIHFRYENVEGTYIDRNGDLVVETLLGELTHKRPLCYQVINGSKSQVRGSFKKVGSNEYKIEVGNYDKSHELIIDPVVLVYSSYLGGSGDEYGVGLAVDDDGFAYLAGDTFSTDFPTKGAYQNTFSGGEKDAYVAKFSATGSSLIYSTFIGGSGNDEGEGIRLDSSGRVYVVGITSSGDFPTVGAYQGTYGGGAHDAIVFIVSANGSSLAYSTYLGGSGDDMGYAIALDSSKNIYLTGQSASTDFPTLNAYQDTFAGGGVNEYDAFVTKIAASGSSLSYSTYIGGNKNETGWGIAVNGTYAFICGRTSSTDYPTKNEYQTAYGGGEYDAFVTKLSSVGNNLIYSTYLGGTLNDVAWGIDVDSTGCAYTTGTTFSTNFPTNNAYQGTFAGGDRDLFLTKFSSTGTSLTYSTFLGGAESEAGAHILVNNSGYAYIVGYTSSTDFPLKRAYQTSYNGDLDGMVAMFTPSGTLSFSTFLGGSDVDSGRGIAVDGNGDIYAAGYTESTDFPIKSAYQNSLKGGKEAFVTKLSTSVFGTICGAVDNCNLTWDTGGDADWFEQVDTYYNDGDAAQSGDIEDSESTYIQTTVIGPGELSFWWKVSSEYDDHLTFYLDGVEKTFIYGTGGGWTQKTYNLGSGAHTLKWAYEKDSYWSYGSDCGWVDMVEFNADTSIILNRDQLTFGSTQGITTGPQTVSVSDAAGGSLNWTAVSNQSWLTCSPGSGSGDGIVTVSVDPTGLTNGTHTGTITVSAPFASNSPQSVTVALEVYGSGHSSLPWGTYETPTNNTTIRSSVPFTGWVLDDLGVQSVKIYRQNGGALTYIGDAIFVEGARPDVEMAYPDYPYNYKAGWGYMMLTNFLPNSGNGTFSIVAIATDLEGHQVSLGTKTVTVDNASAVQPFGALDTPAQGGLASGANYVNWGWVLTPQPNSIPIDGSTLKVWVDGVFLGNPTYNVYRSDIATLFPGYANSGGAAGYFQLDTTSYSNGVHTIQWTATDSGSNSDGIGSRYFMIQNSSSRSGQSSSMDIPVNTIPAPRYPSVLPPVKGAVTDTSSPVGFFTGYQSEEVPLNLEMVYPDDEGMINLDVKEMERLELHLETNGTISGWLKVGNEFRPLPLGSYLDAENGIFYWQMGLAYVGRYHLVFIAEDGYGNQIAKNVLVNILPKY